MVCCVTIFSFFFFQAEDGIRDLVRSRGLGDVYKRQLRASLPRRQSREDEPEPRCGWPPPGFGCLPGSGICLLYTSDAADERSSVDLGGRRIIKKKKTIKHQGR